MPSRKDRRRAGRHAPAAQHYTAQEVELIATLAEALIYGDDAAEGDDMSSMEACLRALLFGKPGHPIRAKAPEAAAGSEIPLVAALRQYATLVRTSADAASTSAGPGSSAAQAGAGCSRPGLQGPFRRRGSLQTAVLELIRKTSSSKTAAGTALRLLCFVQAMLAAQPLHALSHQLAAAAAALEPCGDGAGGGPGGADVDAAAVQQGRSALGCFLESALMFYELLLRDSNMYDDLSRTSLAAAVAAERAAGVEELARGLAESGVLEHAARVLLLLQARGPQAVRPREGAEKILAWEVLDLIYWLGWWAPGPSCISPAAAAQLRSTLSGRCVQTAVLVYDLGTLRLVDRGPAYGLPAALETAGLPMCEPGQGSPGILSLVLLASIPASGDPPAIAGPGTSVELLLRTSRAALGSAAAALPQGLQPRGGVPLPAAPAVPLTSSPCSLLGLALSALQNARRQLPACDASARQSQRREEWWRLAAGALAYGGEFLQGGEYGTDPDVVAWELCRLVAEPLLQLWLNCRRDLNALPAEPPAEVAAALAGGLPQALMALVGGAGTGTLSAGSQCVASALLKACDAQFLSPLLAYGDPEWAAAFLAALGSMRGNGRAQTQASPTSEQGAAGVAGAAAEAPQRCGGVFPTRLGATEPAPLQQLKRVVAQAVGQWCLPSAP